jgi:16S rRNA (guanine527-N7)-methyltransferase
VFAETLAAKLQGLIELSGSQMDMLEKHFLLLQRWNKILNLTSLENPEEVIERHYAESLFLGAQLPAGAVSVVDIGSGAGFPGIPVAVLRPECTVTLVESHKRKSVFLREASRALPNITISADRIEALKMTFDWAISRAVKFEDIENTIVTISNHTALLAGDAQPSSRCFTWNKPIRLPWGEHRYLWVGTSSFHVKQLW